MPLFLTNLLQERHKGEVLLTGSDSGGSTENTYILSSLGQKKPRRWSFVWRVQVVFICTVKDEVPRMLMKLLGFWLLPWFLWTLHATQMGKSSKCLKTVILAFRIGLV